MSSFSIANLAYQLGSNKVSISNLKKKYPKWDIENVKKKTGIKNLFLSKKDEDVLSLSIKSCHKTLKNFNKKSIDCIVVVTQTSKKKLPSISCMIQNELNLNKNIIAFDVGLGCSGFVYGLSIINSMLNSNLVKNALLVCSDTYSKFLNENNRTCKTIFSDAASSCIIKKTNSKKNTKFTFLTDGSGANDLIETNNNIEMKGSNIFFCSEFFKNKKTNSFRWVGTDKKTLGLIEDCKRLLFEKIFFKISKPFSFPTHSRNDKFE